MATAVGLDIGTQSIKVAVLDGSAAKPRLADFIDWKLEGGETTRALGPDRLAALIGRIFDQRKVPRENVVGAVAASRCLLRELQVPFTRDDQIAKTIKFQAESVFPSTSIDDMIVEYYKIEELRPPEKPGAGRGATATAAAERSRLVVAALKKTAIREDLGVLAAAGIDPVALDLDIAALFNAWSRTKEAADGKATLIVDLGGGSMKVLAVEGGRIRGLRALRAQAAGLKVGEKKKKVTLDDLRAGLGENEREDAFFMEEEGRLPVVILDDEQSDLFDLAMDVEARQTVLEKILLEIDRTLAATRLENPIERVFLTGGGARVEGVEKAFSEHFQAPCQRLSLRGALAVAKGARHDDALDLFGATAVGLALKALGYDKTGIDFRKEEFTFAGKFDKAKRGVACALVLLFTFFFLLAYYYQRVEIVRLAKKQQRLQDIEERIYYTLFPEEQEKPPPQRGWLEALKARQRELKGASIDVPEVVSALDMLRDVAQGFEESGKKLALKQLDFRQGQASMRGEVDAENIAYDLKDAVNRKPRLVAIEVEKTSPNAAGKVDVAFKVIAKVPEKKAGPKPEKRPEDELEKE